MTASVENDGRRHGFPWRIVGWGGAACILLLPLAAMQFTQEVNWTAFDFVFAAVLIGGTGLIYELTVRMTRDWACRGGVVAALAAAFLIVWANAAVGMIGDEDNPYNLLFLGVVLIALVGAVAARFRPKGMTIAMAAAAVAHAAVAVVGMSSDLRGGIFSAAFALLWLLSAALFRNAATASTPAETAS